MAFQRIRFPVYAYIPTGPTDPGWGVEAPVDPGYGHPGWSPADPGFDHPTWGGRPDNSLPWAPAHPGGKPPGVPILPPHPDNGLPPASHPWLPGHWVPVDPGYGKPPLWGFIPVDPGFGIPVTPPPTAGNLPATPGHWVPVDPDYGKPVRPCPPVGGKPHPPLWAWIPEIGPDFGTKPTNPIAPGATPKS